MKSKLGGAVAQIMYETAEQGFTPDVRQVIYAEDNLPFHIMTHMDAQKAVLVGLMRDYYGDEVIKSFTINFPKWKYAVYEGFTLKDIFDTEMYKEVFKEIKPHEASSYLMK
tara:strand:- start:12355 stop:12687 length:333 start_codon:yes stop_codon:yes gene_type:complete